MGEIVITADVSLGGVVQDPGGGEGFGRGGWFGRYGGQGLQERGRIEYAEALGTAALLLSWRSEEWFAARWASRPGEFAGRLNSLPEYVVSATPGHPKWASVTVLAGGVVDEVTRLKRQVDGDIVVYAGYQLGCTLIEHGLVGELRLFVFPAVAGAGERLSGETSGTRPLRLTGSRTADDGLVFVTYEIIRDA